MDRECIGWGFACWACMKSMTDSQITDICERHSDVFELKDNTVNFTKMFINEAAKVDSLS